RSDDPFRAGHEEGLMIVDYEILFWIVVALIGYVYIGYPGLVWLWAVRHPRPVRRASTAPRVSIVLVAHNEADRIGRRLENLLSLDYPRDHLEILVGSDGCTDGTAAIARAYESAGVTIVAFERRRGKSAVLNDLVAKARGEIVVLADARQRFEAPVIHALVEPFADPRVGAGRGALTLTHDADGAWVGRGVGFYWRNEKFTRGNERGVASTGGATGAVYATRRELFEPIPDDTILDDVFVPLRISRR